DHGYHLGEHGGIWQKRTLFEEAAKTPLIVRMPGAAGNGRACPRVVELIDLYPTLTAAAGLGVAEGLAGESLVDLLENPESPRESHAVTQILRPADDRFATP